MFYGLASLFWNGPPVVLTEELSPEQSAERDAEEKNRRRQYAASAGIFLLTIVSTILKTVFGIG